MEGLIDMFLQDGTLELIIESYEFPSSGLNLKIQQMEYENSQLQVGVPQVVWMAALSLSKWLDQSGRLEGMKDQVRGLELGSGTGLLGVYTAKRLIADGIQTQFTLTDVDESSLDLIKKNIALNGLPDELIDVSYLKWGSFETATNLPQETQCDIIVGSDIIYSAHVLASLAQTIAHYLKAETGTCYLANNKIRYDNYGAQFEEEIRKAGLQIVERGNIDEDKGAVVMRLLVIKKQ